MEQEIYPTNDEWIKKMLYLHAMEFYSATKKNEILSFTSTWMELENINLSEVSHTQMAKNPCSPSYVDYRPKKFAVILLDMVHRLKREHVQEE
jgi:hypothetical protein